MAINPLQPPINYAGMVPQINIGQQFAELGQVLAERQKRTQAEEVKAAYSTDLQAVLDNPSMKAFNNFSLKYPQQREVIKDVASRFTTEQKDAEFNIGRDVAVALENNEPDIALDILTQTVDARKNSKLPPSVYGQVQRILSNVDDPDRIKKAQAQTNFSLTLLDPEKFGKVVESLEKQKLAPSQLSEQVAKAALAVQNAANAVATAPDDVAKAKAQRLFEEAKAAKEAVDAEFARPKAVLSVQQAGLTLNLTDAQIKQAQAAIRASDAAAKKSGADATLAQRQANEIAAGIIPVDKRPEAESKFRKEYNDQTKPYQEVKSAYGRVLSSDDTAVGDLSLIFGYMKMLDPGSVVREGEFATAQNAAGVPDRIMNIYNKVATGERLNPSQRDSFKGQAKGLYKSALEGEKTVRTGLERISKGYGLNTANIFYSAIEEAPVGAPPAPASNSVKVGSQTYTRPANFTDAQWAAYKQSVGAK